MKELRSNAGFTLMELMIVVVIVGLLAALVAPRFTGKLGEAKTKTTRSQIELLATALESYHLDTGKYPTTEQGLNALLTPPMELKEKWKGPYLKKLKLPVDAWGNPFKFQGRDDTEVKEKRIEYIIISYGGDGKPGGSDEDQDIVSYE